MSSETPSEATPERRKSSRAPLYLRMYTQRHLVEFVRAIGYGGHTETETRERLEPLIETYGQPLVLAAVDELLAFDESQSPPVFRLSEEARRLAIQLLGRPPAADRPQEVPATQTAVESTAKLAPSPSVSPKQTDDSPDACGPTTQNLRRRRSRRPPT